MNGYRLVAVLIGGLLASVALVAPPSAAAEPSAPARRPPFLACPVTAAPSPLPQPRPAPSRDLPRQVVGGEGLATAGLTLPPGVAPPPAATLTARSWLVADLDTGAVLGACGPHEPGAPASVQKLLLAATVLPKLDPAQQVEITREDLNFEPGSSAVGLLEGGHYNVETLWLGLFLNSGNDAANVLARLGGGPAGVPGTIEAMNAEARRLGAKDTHAVTPSGLDASGQATTAYDLALIARACFAREDFRRYDTTQRAQMPPQPPKDPRGYQIQNDNQLLFAYPGAIGGKAGFTDVARHTYVGAAERNGRRLVVTLMGAEARPARGWQQGATLLDWGFSVPAGATVGRLVAPGETQKAATPTATGTAAPAGPLSQAVRRGWPSTALVVVGGVSAGALGLPVLLLLADRRRRTMRSARRGRRRA
jgi:D-alanyl-D-alanine carboxypeptidase (penicillin-binding protein 5/6)